MSPIQQQRLIGAGLLLLLIAVLAYVVLSKVGEYQSQQTLELPEPIEFSSVIEPMDEEGVDNISDDAEAMFDADLQQATRPAPPELAANESDDTSTEVESVNTTVSDQTETTSENTEADTPSAPAAQPIQRPSAPAEKPAPEAEASASASIPENPTVVAEPNAGPTGGDSWLIQLGSFSVQQNALALKTKVEELGYKPYIENSQTDKGPIYRVRLPAINNRTQADQIATRINGQLNIKSQVITQ